MSSKPVFENEFRVFPGFVTVYTGMGLNTDISNIFVDPATMPGWLQAVVAVNPVTHLADASRRLMHGGVLWADIGKVLLASAVITAVFAPIAMRMYYRER